MKINSAPIVSPYVEKTRKTDDSLSRERREQPSSDSQEKRESKDGEKNFEEKLKEVGQAVEKFGVDPASQSYGLKAEVTGQGPGLRVFLKDGTGAVVRQFTGEEFVKMREAAQSTGRGKLLDKKF